MIGLILAALAAAGVYLDDHEVGGMTADEVFAHPATVDLAKAACRGNREEIDRLVARGAQVDDEGYRSVTPLFWAITCQNLDGMEGLLAHGANPNHVMGLGMTPVTQAATYDNGELVAMLLRHGGNPDTDQTADRNNPSEMAQSALEIAFSVGINRDHWGAYYALLNAGADINRKTFGDTGGTIAEWAVDMGRFDKALELVERGYSHDLEAFAFGLMTRIIPEDSPMNSVRERLLSVLADKGVDVPTLRRCYEADVGMVECKRRGIWPATEQNAQEAHTA